MREKIEVPRGSPEMGSAVSKGEFGTNVPEGPNGAGLVWAKNGAPPVAVGPIANQKNTYIW